MTLEETGEEFSIVKKCAKKFSDQGYNILPILPKGARYPFLKKGNSTVRIKRADGKSAEGLGWWRDWMEKKQESNFIDTFDEVLEKANNKLTQYMSSEDWARNKITTLNLALVCGDVSGDEEYSCGVVDIDGPAKMIWAEALLLLESQNEELAQKIRDSPQTKTPSGGSHIHFQYRKNEFTKPLRSKSIYTGKNKHEEIEILANGRYVLEPPSAGYVPVKGDFDKIARLSGKELEQLTRCLSTVIGEQQPPEESKKTKWINDTNTTQQAHNEEAKVSEQSGHDIELIEIGKKLYIEPTRHKFVLRYAAYMRRYIRMHKEAIHQVIEALAPEDQKNWQAVEDVFKKPVYEIANRTTLRHCIKEITKDERKTDNFMRELMSFEPVPKQTHGEEFADDEEQEQKPAAKLLDLAIENTELCFKDQDGNYYAMIHNEITDAYDIIDLDSEEFDQILSGLYRQDTNYKDLAKKDWKTQVVVNLKNIVNEKRLKKELHYRSVWDMKNKAVYYNLANEKGEIVEITPAENEVDMVRIVKQTPELLKFKKLPESHEQVRPDLDIGDTDYLQKMLDEFKFENEDDKLILKCLIVVIFLNAPPYPIDLATGRAGCGKSTLKRQQKSLIDPNESNIEDINAKVTALSHKLNLDPNKAWDRELIVLGNQYTAFDNVTTKTIPGEIMDEFCQYSTGIKDSRKKNYTDKERVEQSGARPVGITTIENTITNTDLLTRVFEHRLLKPVKNKSDIKIAEDFYDLKPKIFGYICKIISRFLSKYDDLKDTIEPKTRLTNFEVLAEIISRCFGNDRAEKFQDIWIKRKGEQIKESAGNSTFGLMMQDYVQSSYDQNIYDNRKSVDTTASDLQLEFAANKKYNIDSNKQSWLYDPRQFGAELTKMMDSLEAVGIQITRLEKKVKNQRMIRIDYSEWIRKT